MHRLLALSTTIGDTDNFIYDTPFSPASNFKDFGSLISVVVTNAIAAAGVIAFIYMIIAVFGIIRGAGGDPKKLQEAKSKLTMALVGLLIVAFSLWFMQALEIFIGFNPLKPPIN